mgnify:CR=1 FL=1
MTPEAALRNSILSLVSGGVFFTTVEINGLTKPIAIINQIGGISTNFLDGSKPSKRHLRYQINVFATSQLEANTIARQIEDTVRTTFKAYVDGEAASAYDETSNLFGTRQDFSFSYDS